MQIEIFVKGTQRPGKFNLFLTERAGEYTLFTFKPEIV